MRSSLMIAVVLFVIVLGASAESNAILSYRKGWSYDYLFKSLYRTRHGQFHGGDMQCHLTLSCICAEEDGWWFEFQLKNVSMQSHEMDMRYSQLMENRMEHEPVTFFVSSHGNLSHIRFPADDDTTVRHLKRTILFLFEFANPLEQQDPRDFSMEENDGVSAYTAHYQVTLPSPLQGRTFTILKRRTNIRQLHSLDVDVRQGKGDAELEGHSALSKLTVSGGLLTSLFGSQQLRVNAVVAAAAAASAPHPAQQQQQRSSRVGDRRVNSVTLYSSFSLELLASAPAPAPASGEAGAGAGAALPGAISSAEECRRQLLLHRRRPPSHAALASAPALRGSGAAAPSATPTTTTTLRGGVEEAAAAASAAASSAADWLGSVPSPHPTFACKYPLISARDGRSCVCHDHFLLTDGRCVGVTAPKTEHDYVLDSLAPPVWFNASNMGYLGEDAARYNRIMNTRHSLLQTSSASRKFSVAHLTQVLSILSSLMANADGWSTVVSNLGSATGTTQHFLSAYVDSKAGSLGQAELQEVVGMIVDMAMTIRIGATDDGVLRAVRQLRMVLEAVLGKVGATAAFFETRFKEAKQYVGKGATAIATKAASVAQSSLVGTPLSSFPDGLGLAKDVIAAFAKPLTPVYTAVVAFHAGLEDIVDSMADLVAMAPSMEPCKDPSEKVCGENRVAAIKSWALTLAKNPAVELNKLDNAVSNVVSKIRNFNGLASDLSDACEAAVQPAAWQAVVEGVMKTLKFTAFDRSYVKRFGKPTFLEVSLGGKVQLAFGTKAALEATGFLQMSAAERLQVHAAAEAGARERHLSNLALLEVAEDAAAEAQEAMEAGHGDAAEAHATAVAAETLVARHRRLSSAGVEVMAKGSFGIYLDMAAFSRSGRVLEVLWEPTVDSVNGFTHLEPNLFLLGIDIPLSFSKSGLIKRLVKTVATKTIKTILTSDAVYKIVAEKIIQFLKQSGYLDFLDCSPALLQEQEEEEEEGQLQLRDDSEATALAFLEQAVEKHHSHRHHHRHSSSSRSSSHHHKQRFHSLAPKPTRHLSAPPKSKHSRHHLHHRFAKGASAASKGSGKASVPGAGKGKGVPAVRKGAAKKGASAGGNAKAAAGGGGGGGGSVCGGAGTLMSVMDSTVQFMDMLFPPAAKCTGGPLASTRSSVDTVVKVLRFFRDLLSTLLHPDPDAPKLVAPTLKFLQLDSQGQPFHTPWSPEAARLRDDEPVLVFVELSAGSGQRFFENLSPAAITKAFDEFDKQVAALAKTAKLGGCVDWLTPVGKALGVDFSKIAKDEAKLKEAVTKISADLKKLVAEAKGLVSSAYDAVHGLEYLFSLMGDPGQFLSIVDVRPFNAIANGGKAGATGTGGLKGMSTHLTAISALIAKGSKPLADALTKAATLTTSVSGKMTEVDKFVDGSLGTGLRLFGTIGDTIKAKPDVCVAVSDISKAISKEVPAVTAAVKAVSSKDPSAVKALAAVGKFGAYVDTVAKLAQGGCDIYTQVKSFSASSAKELSTKWAALYKSVDGLLVTVQSTMALVGFSDGNIITTAAKFMQRILSSADGVLKKLVLNPKVDEDPAVNGIALWCEKGVAPTGAKGRPLWATSLPIFSAQIGPIPVAGVPVTVTISIDAQFLLELQTGQCQSSLTYFAIAPVMSAGIAATVDVGIGVPFFSAGVTLKVTFVEVQVPLQIDVSVEKAALALSCRPVLSALGGSIGAYIRIFFKFSATIFKWAGIRKQFAGLCYSSDNKAFNVCGKAAAALELAPPSTNHPSFPTVRPAPDLQCYLCRIDLKYSDQVICPSYPRRYAALAGGPNMARAVNSFFSSAYSDLHNEKQHMELVSSCGEWLGDWSGDVKTVPNLRSMYIVRWLKEEREDSLFEVIWRMGRDQKYTLTAVKMRLVQGFKPKSMKKVDVTHLKTCKAVAGKDGENCASDGKLTFPAGMKSSYELAMKHSSDSLLYISPGRHQRKGLIYDMEPMFTLQADDSVGWTVDVTATIRARLKKRGVGSFLQLSPPHRNSSSSGVGDGNDASAAPSLVEVSAGGATMGSDDLPELVTESMYTPAELLALEAEREASKAAAAAAASAALLEEGSAAPPKAKAKAKVKTDPDDLEATFEMSTHQCFGCNPLYQKDWGSATDAYLSCPRIGARGTGVTDAAAHFGAAATYINFCLDKAKARYDDIKKSPDYATNRKVTAVAVCDERRRKGSKDLEGWVVVGPGASRTHSTYFKVVVRGFFDKANAVAKVTTWGDMQKWGKTACEVTKHSEEGMGDLSAGRDRVMPMLFQRHLQQQNMWQQRMLPCLPSLRIPYRLRHAEVVKASEQAARLSELAMDGEEDLSDTDPYLSVSTDLLLDVDAGYDWSTTRFTGQCFACSVKGACATSDDEKTARHLAMNIEKDANKILDPPIAEVITLMTKDLAIAKPGDGKWAVCDERAYLTEDTYRRDHYGGAVCFGHGFERRCYMYLWSGTAKKIIRTIDLGPARGGAGITYLFDQYLSYPLYEKDKDAGYKVTELCDAAPGGAAM